MDITTQGNFQEELKSMDVGDYIAVEYNTADVKTLGTFTNLGNVDTGDSTNVQFDIDTPTLNGYIYLTKIDTGVLLSNQLLFSGVVYKDMNTQNLIAGSLITIGSKKFLVRVPSMRELMKADSTLDGLVDIKDVTTNFNTDTSKKELIQENYNLTQGVFGWSNTASATTSNAKSSTAAVYSRLAFIYVDNDKSTDVFH